MPGMSELISALQSVNDESRKEYHVTLGEMVDFLDRLNKDGLISHNDSYLIVDELNSYRGYYSDLAFYVRKATPDEEPTTVGTLLKDLKWTIGSTFQGYKGGEFPMTKNTPLWIEYGEWRDCSNEAILILKAGKSGGLVIESKKIEY